VVACPLPADALLPGDRAGLAAYHAPDVFWQPLDSLQAGRFTFEYGPRDAAAVLDASRHVEALDAEIRAELGLPVTNDALTVTILGNGLLSLDPVDLACLAEGATLYAPSPSLLPLPLHISEAEALRQLIASLLTGHSLHEAWAGSPVCNWQLMVDGVRHRLLWEYSELPSSSAITSSTDSRRGWPQIRGRNLPGLGRPLPRVHPACITAYRLPALPMRAPPPRSWTMLWPPTAARACLA